MAIDWDNINHQVWISSDGLIHVETVFSNTLTREEFERLYLAIQDNIDDGLDGEHIAWPEVRRDYERME